MNTFKNIFYCFLLVLSIVVFHFFVPSTSNGYPTDGFNFDISRLYQNEVSEEIFNERINYAIYRSRPFVLEFQNFFKEKLDIPYQLSFNIINYLSLFLLFILLRRIDEENNISKHTFGLPLLFYFSMPILFVFLASLGTHDDLIQFLFVLLAYYFFKKRPSLSALFFTLSLICRETSFIFYFPIIAYLIYNNSNWKDYILWVIPGIAFFAFQAYYLPDEMVNELKEFSTTTRLTALRSNFGTMQDARESIVMMFAMVVPYVWLMLSNYKHSKTQKEKVWSLLFLLFLIGNTILIAMTGLVREVRLMFLPLVIILPIYAKQIIVMINRLFLIKIRNTPILVLALIVGFITFYFYTPMVVGTGYIFKLYLCVYLMIVGLMVFESNTNKQIIS